MLPYVGNDVRDFILAHQFVIADMGSLVPPWALFFMNPMLRTAIFGSVARSPTPCDTITTVAPTDMNPRIQLF